MQGTGYRAPGTRLFCGSAGTDGHPMHIGDVFRPHGDPLEVELVGPVHRVPRDDRIRELPGGPRWFRVANGRPVHNGRSASHGLHATQRSQGVAAHDGRHRLRSSPRLSSSAVSAGNPAASTSMRRPPSMSEPMATWSAPHSSSARSTALPNASSVSPPSSHVDSVRPITPPAAATSRASFRGEVARPRGVAPPRGCAARPAP